MSPSREVVVVARVEEAVAPEAVAPEAVAPEVVFAGPARCPAQTLFRTRRRCMARLLMASMRSWNFLPRTVRTSRRKMPTDELRSILRVAVVAVAAAELQPLKRSRRP